MKKAIFTLVFLLIANYVVGQIQIVPKLGYVFQHREGFGAPRISLSANNIIKERVGFYYSLEYRGGIQFQEDQTNFTFVTS